MLQSKHMAYFMAHQCTGSLQQGCMLFTAEKNIVRNVNFSFYTAVKVTDTLIGIESAITFVHNFPVKQFVTCRCTFLHIEFCDAQLIT